MIYTPKRVFPAKDVPLAGLDNIRLHLGDQPSKLLPPQKKIGGNRYFAAKSAK